MKMIKVHLEKNLEDLAKALILVIDLAQDLILAIDQEQVLHGSKSKKLMMIHQALRVTMNSLSLLRKPNSRLYPPLMQA